MTWLPEIDELHRREDLARQMGGAEKVAKHHAQGRLAVRERINLLLDADTFHETGALAGKATYEGGKLTAFQPANFVLGTGKIEGRKVVVAGDDFTVRGGAADAAIMGKQVYAEKMAHDLLLPLVRLVDGTGGGGSVKSLDDMGYTYVPYNPGWDYVVANLGRVPVVAAALGSTAGLGAARLAAAHFSIMVAQTSQLFVAGPPVVRYGMGQDLSKEELGGVAVHRSSGAVDNIASSEEDAFRQIRRFLSYLPRSAWELPPMNATSEDDPGRREESLLSAIPRNRRRVYKIRPILDAIFDAGSVFEMGREVGGATVTAFARLDGCSVGVLAPDPYVGGGGLSALGADKLARFVDLCGTFHLPVVNLVDQPGLVIGLDAERGGAIRHGVRAIAAVYQARIPMVEVILRRVFGVGGAGMTNAHGLNLRYAWPSGDWGSLPVEGGIEVAFRRDLEASDDPAGMREEILARMEGVRSPFRTAEAFGIEEIIDPRDTRPLLCEWVHDAYRLLPSLLGPWSHAMRP